MKKLLKTYAKKSLALFMACLMLMSAWVFVAPVPEVHAAQETLNYTLQELYDTYLTEDSGATFIKGSFPADSQTPGDGLYVNVLYSPNYTTNDIYTGPASNKGTVISQETGCGAYKTTLDVIWHHAETVMLYDGKTAPQTGVMVTTDPNCDGGDGSSTVERVWITTSNFAHPDYWKGICGANLDFAWAMTQGNQLNYLETTTNSSMKISRKNSDTVPVYGNLIRYTGSMGSSTFLLSVKPSFSCYAYNDVTNKTISATSSKYIHVVNYKTLKETIAEAKTYINNNVFSNANKDIYTKKYTAASLAKLQELANALVAAKPDTTYFDGNNKCLYNEYAADAKAAVDNWNAWIKGGGLVEATYTVTWNGCDVTQKNENLKYNDDVPAYNGEPTKNHEVKTVNGKEMVVHYEFKGWDPTPSTKVTGDATYTAQFEPVEVEMAIRQDNYDPSTCTHAGSYDEVKYCSVCKHEFSTTHKPMATLTHTFTAEVAHDDYLISAATCDKKAKYAKSCVDCGKRSELETAAYTFEYGEVDLSKHIIVPVKGTAPSCSSEGIRDHWTCTVCLTLFGDEEGKTVINNEDIEMEALPHTEQIIPGRDSTCTDAGYENGIKCSVCNEIILEQKPKELLPHEDTDHDHICDNGCGEELTDHVDDNFDHICDNGCGEKFGEHKDTDKDHRCDYCDQTDEAFGPHEDKDKNHKCDYGCDVEIGICQDADKDHKCDWGCGAEYGNHADTNKDHNCDYGCEETIGKHEDTDFDHKCEYGCSESIGNCEDNDKDHDCDYGCDNYFGAHIDENRDHNCDYGCTVKIGDHADAEDDKDHKCDYCGEDNMNPHINSEVVIENDVKATCETNGSYDEVIYCTVCDAVISRKTVVVDALTHGWTVEYNWSADGKACTATRVCANDESHNQTAEATINSEIIRDPACGVRGITKYTATFATGWAGTQVVELDDIDPECPDTDKNHYCDNNEGNKDHYVGVHEDKNKDHVCDYGCEESIGAHEDKDKDHKCDWGCGGDFGLDQCKDDNKDHKCDYGCSKKYGDHADSDTDNDHKCDYCGEDNMNPHVEGAELVEDRVEPTCSKKGSYKLVVRCTVCNVVLRSETKSIDTIPHTWKAEIEYSFNEKTEEFTATRTCSVCGATESASKKAEVTVTVQVTCNNPGEKVYTVENIVDWAPDAQRKVVAVPQLQHEDADKDHYCDNGCGNVTGTCEDLNFDHYCDYGRNCKLTVYPAHEDKDNDHKCDYGCRTKDFAAHEWKAHSEIDTIKTPATCVSPAIYNSHCEYCGKVVEGATHTYGEVDTENGHRFDGKAVAVEGDKHAVKCTNEGCNEIKYVDCSYQTTKMVAATCKAAGYKVEKCPICKASKRTVLEKDPANHAGGTTVKNAFAATCSTDGYTGDVYCLGCDTKLEDGKAITANPNIHAHENMKDYEKVDSTCSAEGHEAYRYCDKCGTYAVEKITIDKKAHEYEEYNSNGDGTHKATCGKCGETEEVACSGGKANCVDKKVCEFCNTAYGEVDLSNHKTRVTVPKKAATCQVEGYLPYVKCEACDTALEEITPIPTAEHIYSGWSKVAGEDNHQKYCVTCDEKLGTVATQKEACSGGYAYCNKLAACKVCKSEYGSFDPAHHRSTVTTLVGVKVATCTEEGYTGDAYYICCYDANKTVEENASAFAESGTATAIVDHDYSVVVENKSANCKEAGYAIYKCATCPAGAEVTKTVNFEINPKNHKSASTVIVGEKPATCLEDGFTGNVYYDCCYDATKSEEENKVALMSKGTVIKSNGEHSYSEAYPEYMIEELIIEKDKDGNVISVDGSIKTETPSYEEMVAARRDDGFWYHIQVCAVCYEIKEERCYSYTSDNASCIATEVCEVCEGLCSLKNEKKHASLEKVEGKAATCTENGIKDSYKCNDCGKQFFDAAGRNEITDANKDKLVITANGSHTIDRKNQKPVSKGNGTHAYICSVCNEAEIVEDCSGGTATCKTLKSCQYCEASYGELNERNHEGVTVEIGRVEPDRCKPGVKGKVQYQCCGKVVSGGEEIPATEEHSWNVVTSKTDNCAMGYTITRTCDVCGTVEVEDVAAGTHNLTKKVYESEKDCTKDRYIYYACTICSHTDAEVTIDGVTYKYISVDVIPASGECKWTAWNTVKATCIAEGSQSRSCIVCGNTENIVLPIVAHTVVVEGGYAATCEKAGKQEYAYCAVPGCPYAKGGKPIGAVPGYEKYANSKGEVINALNHGDYNNDDYCDNCGRYEGVNIDGTNCNCVCHKQNGFMKLIYKFMLFFWKLFGINKTCCSASIHY